MKHVPQLARDRAVIGIGRHDVAHVAPPALAFGHLRDRLPARLVLDLHVTKQLPGFRMQEDRVVVHAVGFQHTLEFRPDGAMAPLIFDLLALTLKAGESLRFRYRVLIHPGDTQSAKIGDEFKKYAGQNPSAAARVADFALLAGHWQGKIGSAEIEEVWTAPGNGGMIGMFRLMQNGRLSMSEFMTVDETPEGAVMHMRHFAAGLKPREEQALVWQVVEKGNNKLLLRTGETQLRFNLESPDALTAVLIKGGKETAFRYRRVAAANPTSDR